MATAQIFLHGHGGWKPTDGYTEVPRNSSVTFYTHFAKLLNATMAYPILGNTYTNQHERVIEQYKLVPDMVLSNLTVGQRQTATNIFSGGGGRNLYMLPASPPRRVTLSALMKWFREKVSDDVMLQFHWIACQQLGLKAVGGGEFGVNASDRSNQVGHEGEYLLKWRDGDGVEQTRFLQSDSTFNRR